MLRLSHHVQHLGRSSQGSSPTPITQKLCELEQGVEVLQTSFLLRKAGTEQFLPRRAVVGLRQLMYAKCLAL